ncbi:polysaccharide deacetylase [Embleya scabrispora]|uniref:Polysaccharide deacetylase n=2 Tax=Embleya scabrispora TaxID=159449 RepID=A0A1T3NNB1_9ACTN|nr:polysaccharide deacetylase [Embleya scabrispora]
MRSPSWRALTRWGVALGLCACLAGSGCADQDADMPRTKPGQPVAAANAPGGPGVPAAPAAPIPDAVREQAAAQIRAAGLSAEREVAARIAASRAAAARKWGLAQTPIAAPAPPATRPVLKSGPGVIRHGDLPPVVHRVPTQDRVVFLTVDDGAEKDPRFARMARELGVPFSAFVSGYLARGGWAYFRGLHEQGVVVNNHTVNHPDLRKLGYARQQQEICGEQEVAEREIGVASRLFRPPYGEFNQDTLRAAQSCGIVALPIWNQEAFPDRIEYRYDHRLEPGDIILTHFRGPGEWKGDIAQMLRRVVDTATAQGFALARLDDYL